MFAWSRALLCFGFLPAFAHADNCDAVLASQIDVVLADQSAQLSWLSLIDDNSYKRVQQKAGGSYYGDLLSGDYKNFEEKRRSLFTQQNYNLDVRSSREEFKSYLAPHQTEEWRRCKAANTELLVTYENVDELGLTLRVEWVAPPTVGTLRNIKFGVEGGTVRRGWPFGPDSLAGSESYTVTRKKGEPFRGTVTGKAGVGAGVSYTAAVYVPAYAPPKGDPPPPPKAMSDVTGQVYKSWAYWNRGRSVAKSTVCMAEQPGMDLVVVAVKSRYLGQSRGACMKNDRHNYCDSRGEFCQDEVVASGCYVNKEWHDWYKRTMKTVGTPYSKEAVCAKPEQKG